MLGLIVIFPPKVSVTVAPLARAYPELKFMSMALEGISRMPLAPR